MGREEQIEEREVLDSIFPDEITDISAHEYRISIALDIPHDDDADDEDAPQPVLLLTVRYPEDYPDKAPHLDIAAGGSGDGDGGAARHPHLDVAADRAALLAALAPTVAENLGMAMVFALVSTLKEAAEQLAARRRGAAAAQREAARAAAEREENRRFHGAPVTRAAFLAWRAAFAREAAAATVAAAREDARLAELKKARGGAGAREPVRLTGRQLWERGLAKGEEVEEGEDGGAAAPAEEMGKLKVSA